MPTADGETQTYSLYEANDKQSEPMPYQFALKNVEGFDDDSVWLRYDVKGPVEEQH